jgi:hypothetical protein
VITEYTTFRVIEGKEAVAEEWLATLSARKAECVATLDREKMAYESIFKFYQDGRLYLSWFSVQGEGHAELADSEHEVDKIHLWYWNECIDRSFAPVEHSHVVSFVPKPVEDVIATLYDS